MPFRCEADEKKGGYLKVMFSEIEKGIDQDAALLLPFCNSQFFYSDNVTFCYFVLFSTCFNNCVHSVHLLITILAGYGISGRNL